MDFDLLSTQAAWSAASASVIGELRVPEHEILDAAVLAEAYDRSVRAQLDLARTIGFEPGWRFAGKKTDLPPHSDA